MSHQQRPLRSPELECHIDRYDAPGDVRRWDQFRREAQQVFAKELFEDIVCSSIMITGSTYEKIGLHDERAQAADWGLHYTLRKREAGVGDVRRCMVVSGALVPHFMRATVRGKREPFVCAHPKVSIDEKWDKAEQAQLWGKPQEFSVEPESLSRFMKKRVIGPLEKFGRECDRALAWRGLWCRPERIVDLYRRQFKLLGPGSPAAGATTS